MWRDHYFDVYPMMSDDTEWMDEAGTASTWYIGASSLRDTLQIR